MTSTDSTEGWSEYRTILIRRAACGCGWTSELDSDSPYAEWGEHAKEVHGYVTVGGIFRPGRRG